MQVSYQDSLITALKKNNIKLIYICHTNLLTASRKQSCGTNLVQLQLQIWLHCGTNKAPQLQIWLRFGTNQFSCKTQTLLRYNLLCSSKQLPQKFATPSQSQTKPNQKMVVSASHFYPSHLLSTTSKQNSTNKIRFKISHQLYLSSQNKKLGPKC